MDSVGLDGQRQVHAVIDNEEAAGLPAAASELQSERIDLDGREGLLPELDQPAAAGKDGVQERPQLPTTGCSPVEDDIERRRKSQLGQRQGGQGPTSRRGSECSPERNAGSARSFW